MRAVAVVLSLAAAAVASAPMAQPSAPAQLEARFDAAVDPAEIGGWIKQMGSAPIHVGAPHNKANAERTAALFREWGFDARIETFDVLFPTPISQKLELLGPKRFKATLTEAPVRGDASSTRTKGQLPAYLAFGGDGDVTGELVYVNYGSPEDYRTLERMGVSVRGKIVIARYGQIWRGLKPKLAYEHGAIGAIIYSDPRDDGYAVNDAYPAGPARPANAVQRGSVADMTLFPGDPLTPGVAATKDAPRLTLAEAPTIMKIPVLPISYGDAQVFLAQIGGNVVPPAWRGSLPITYHVGPGPARVRLKVKSDWSMKPVYNVVAVMPGSQFPDQWVMRGNHRDAWVFGASDPLSGHAAMMAEAKAFGVLASSGWRPKRSLVYLSWDAEEPMLLGSTEWAEAHAAELKDKALVYINSDGNGRGFFSAGGTASLQRLVTGAMADVIDPQIKVSVLERARAKVQVDVAGGGASEIVRARARAAQDGRDMPISPLGSGSDYTPFLQHLGVPSLNIGFGGEGESGGVYHSAYDTYEHHSRFVDPGFAYGAALAKIGGRLMLRLADAEAPMQRYGDFADTIAGYVDEVRRLADTKRSEAAAQARLLSAGLYRLADDPTKTNGPPSPLQPVPSFNFAPLDDAAAHLTRSAHDFDREMEAMGETLSAEQRAQIHALLQPIEQTLLHDDGLPQRSWYKHLIYAPGRATGYGVKTLPGVREAIEEERFGDFDRYAALTGAALEAFAARLDAASGIVRGR